MSTETVQDCSNKLSPLPPAGSGKQRKLTTHRTPLSKRKHVPPSPLPKRVPSLPLVRFTAAPLHLVDDRPSPQRSRYPHPPSFDACLQPFQPNKKVDKMIRHLVPPLPLASLRTNLPISPSLGVHPNSQTQPSLYFCHLSSLTQPPSSPKLI